MHDQSALARFAHGHAVNTVWVVKLSHEVVAIRHDGTIVARGEHVSSVESAVRIMAADPGANIWAIAVAINPADRQPKRKLPRQRRWI